VIHLTGHEPRCEVNMIGVWNHPTGVQPSE
jgi:hypothetical protein